MAAATEWLGGGAGCSYTNTWFGPHSREDFEPHGEGSRPYPCLLLRHGLWDGQVPVYVAARKSATLEGRTGGNRLEGCAALDNLALLRCVLRAPLTLSPLP